MPGRRGGGPVVRLQGAEDGGRRRRPRDAGHREAARGLDPARDGSMRVGVGEADGRRRRQGGPGRDPPHWRDPAGGHRAGTACHGLGQIRQRGKRVAERTRWNSPCCVWATARSSRTGRGAKIGPTTPTKHRSLRWKRCTCRLRRTRCWSGGRNCGKCRDDAKRGGPWSSLRPEACPCRTPIPARTSRGPPRCRAAYIGRVHATDGDSRIPPRPVA